MSHVVIAPSGGTGGGGGNDPRLTIKQLTGGNVTSASATGAEVAGLAQATGTGVYDFRYMLYVRSELTSNGAKFGVNHDGTAELAGALLRFPGSTSAADGVVATPQAFPGSAARAFSTTSPNLGPYLSVDAADANIPCVIEGTVNVSVAGNLELWFASEDTNDAIMQTDISYLILTKVG